MESLSCVSVRARHRRKRRSAASGSARARLAAPSTRSRIASATASFESIADLALAAGLDQGDRVALGLEADLGVGDVVEDDHVGALALELVAGALQAPPPCLGGEADDGLALGALRGDGRRGCPRSARGEVEAVAPAPELARRGLARAGSRPGRRPSAGRGRRGTRLAVASASSAAVVDVDAAHAGGLGQGDVGGDQRHLAPRAARRPRPGRGPCGRWSGCRRSAPGRSAPACRRRVTSTRSPSQGRLAGGQDRLDLGQQRSGSGSRPRPCSPREASAPSSGSITVDAALAQRREVGLGRRVGVHAVVHRRGDQARRRAGEEGRSSPSSRRCRRPAWRWCSPRRARPGRRRRCAATSRWPIGSCSGARVAREGAAQRVALELRAQHRGADDALEGGRPDEALGALGHQHADAVAGLGRERAPARAPCRRRSRRSRRAGSGPSQPPVRLTALPPQTRYSYLSLPSASSSSEIER